MKPTREAVISTPDESIQVLAIDPESFGCPFHYHAEYEVAWISHGQGIRIVGDNVSAFGPGDLCLIGPNLPHIYRAEPGSYPSAVVIHFSSEFVARLESSFHEARPLATFCRRMKNGLVFHHHHRPDSWFGQQFANLSVARGMRRLLIFLELLHDLMETGASEAASPGYLFTPPVDSSEQIVRACEYILSHSQDPIEHEEIAARAGMSPSAFSRHFKRVTGLTCTQFINRVRLGHASRLLQEETDAMSIAEIAFASGFENLSNFNRRFRERYGRSPRDYRRLCADGNRVSELAPVGVDGG